MTARIDDMRRYDRDMQTSRKRLHFIFQHSICMRPTTNCGILQIEHKSSIAFYVFFFSVSFNGKSDLFDDLSSIAILVVLTARLPLYFDRNLNYTWRINNKIIRFAIRVWINLHSISFGKNKWRIFYWGEKIARDICYLDYWIVSNWFID